MAKRSRKATGTYEKTGNNSYRLSVRHNGDRFRKIVRASSDSEAVKLLNQFAAEVYDEGYVAPTDMKLKHFVAEWQKRFAGKHFAPSTLSLMNYNIDRYILPILGDKKMASINVKMLHDFMDDLSAPGLRKDGSEGSLSASTINASHRALRSLFKVAMEWEVISRNNMLKVKKPKIEKKNQDVYTTQEMQDLVIHLQDEKPFWRLFVMLSLFSGMRRSEVLGLEDKHLNFNKNTLKVEQALTYANKQYHLREPKSETSKRPITLPSVYAAELKEYMLQRKKERIQFGELWQGGDHFYVFSSIDGQPLNPSSVTTWWRRFTKRKGLRHIPFKNLRHTSATWLIMGGENIKTVSSRLGHADIKITMNTYTQALEEADQTAASKFNDFMSKKA